MVMTQKIAFLIVKILEIYALRQSTQKTLKYDLIYISVSSFGDYKLIIVADWLHERTYKDVLIEILTLFKAKWKVQTPRPIAIIFETTNSRNARIQELMQLYSGKIESREYLQNGYFSAAPNTSTDEYEEGYILYSKILQDFEFGKLQNVFVAEAEMQKLIPTSFVEDNDNCYINFVEEQDSSKSSKIDIFDIYEMQQLQKYPKRFMF
jgi:hypothetical protein